MLRVIKSPVVSEQAVALKEKQNTYLFRVARRANKHQIAEAVREMFGVSPLRVRTAIMKGKKRSLNKYRKLVYAPDWKKAFVTLKKGEKIKELD